MSERQKLNSLFYDVTEKISKSSLNTIAFDRKEKVDPELISHFFGEDISSDDAQKLQDMVDTLPERKYLELSMR